MHSPGIFKFGVEPNISPDAWTLIIHHDISSEVPLIPATPFIGELEYISSSETLGDSGHDLGMYINFSCPTQLQSFFSSSTTLILPHDVDSTPPHKHTVQKIIDTYSLANSLVHLYIYFDYFT